MLCGVCQFCVFAVRFDSESDEKEKRTRIRRNAKGLLLFFFSWKMLTFFVRRRKSFFLAIVVSGNVFLRIAFFVLFSEISTKVKYSAPS